jgi:hypothetical protein
MDTTSRQVMQHPRVTFFGSLVALAETLIAAAVLAGFARKLSYPAAILPELHPDH